MNRRSIPVIAVGVFSRFEFALRSTALMLAAVRASGSVVTTALIGMGAILPTVVMSGLVARMIARRGAKTTLLMGSVVIILIYSVLFFTFEIRQNAWIYPIFALLFGMARPFVDNSVNILVLENSDDLQLEKTNGVLSMGQSLAGIFGPSAAGVLFALGAQIPFLVASIVAFTVCLLNAVIPLSTIVSRQETKERAGAWRLLTENHAIAALTVAGFLSNISAGCFLAVIPIFLLDDLKISSQAYGINSSLQSVGIVAASVAFIFLVSRLGAWRLAIVGGAIQSIAVLGIFSSQTVGFILLYSLINGVGLGCWNASSSSALLRLAKGVGQEKVIPLNRSLNFAGAPIGNVLGIVIGSPGTSRGLLASGVLMCICVIVMFVMGDGNRAEKNGSAERSVH